MNQTSASPGTAGSTIGDLTSLLTTVHLVWLAVLAVLVVIGILYGARVKRRRLRAEHRTVEHAHQAGVPPTPAAAEPAPPVTPPAEPVAVEEPTPDARPPESTAFGGPVTQLKGLGPKVAARLAELGITSVGQLAALDHDAAQALDAQLGVFAGRLERDRWVEQARFLAAGDRPGFEAVFGKL